MLKGGTLPSLLAQKLSRWYSAYSGVFLWSLLGFLTSMMEYDCYDQMYHDAKRELGCGRERETLREGVLDRE